MQAVHQAAPVPPQSFHRILDLSVIIQPADLFNRLGPAARISQILDEIFRMTAPFLFLY